MRSKNYLKGAKADCPSIPERDLIVSRYLKRQRHLTREALSRLLADDAPSGEIDGVTLESEVVERALTLHTQRLQTVFSVIKATGAKRVLDLGCGEGKLLRLFLAEKQFESILRMDVLLAIS
jgi:2-polyprenyl-3-methyl-5-hydroxy-6-metoxy-1,4-benzoquinol methylase